MQQYLEEYQATYLLMQPHVSDTYFSSLVDVLLSSVHQTPFLTIFTLVELFKFGFVAGFWGLIVFWGVFWVCFVLGFFSPYMKLIEVLYG